MAPSVRPQLPRSLYAAAGSRRGHDRRPLVLPGDGGRTSNFTSTLVEARPGRQTRASRADSVGAFLTAGVIVVFGGAALAWLVVTVGDASV